MLDPKTGTRGLRAVLYAAVGVAVLVAEPFQRDADFVFGKLVLLLTRQSDWLARLSLNSIEPGRKESGHPRRRAYPVRNHLVNSPPRAPESHNLFGLGIVGQIVNHLGIVDLFIRRLYFSDMGDLATKMRPRVAKTARCRDRGPFFSSTFRLSGRTAVVQKLFAQPCIGLAWLERLAEPAGADKRLSCDLADKLLLTALSNFEGEWILLVVLSKGPFFSLRPLDYWTAKPFLSKRAGEQNNKFEAER